jgi:Ni/Fe-hydrogenase subunit HybB-like protein
MHLTPSVVNVDLLQFVLRTPRWFWFVGAGLALVLGVGVAGEIVMIVVGLQVLGLTNTVSWAVLITNFIFWVGISHAGVMISAILRLTHAEWRRPITRCAEVLAIFALLTAALFPLIHSGRVWRTIYWVFPYDFARDLWPNIRSALIWDPSAILTYLTGTVLFVYVGLIPDLAVARDRARGRRRHIYGALALGFRGTSRQWRIQAIAGLLLSALILPVFVSVHSIVAWDLSMAILPAWHTTLLAPYFVMGAVHSGVAGVVIVMVVLRRALHVQAYIGADHFDKIGRLQIVVAFGYLYFFLCDFYFGLFARDPVEERIWELRLFESPTNILMFAQILATLLIPLPLWFIGRVRRNPAIMLWISVVVNIGMWLERYLLVVTPQSLKQPFVFTWVSTYEPRPMEYLFTFVSIALVATGVLLFAKLLPIVPITEIKEGLTSAAGHLPRA